MQFSQHCHLFFKLLHAYWLLFFRIGLGIVRIFSSAFYPPSAFSYPRFILHPIFSSAFHYPSAFFHPRFILHPHFLIRVLSSIHIFSSAFYPPSAFSHPYFLIRIRHPYPHPRFIPTLKISGEFHCKNISIFLWENREQNY